MLIELNLLDLMLQENAFQSMILQSMKTNAWIC